MRTCHDMSFQITHGLIGALGGLLAWRKKRSGAAPRSLILPGTHRSFLNVFQQRGWAANQRHETNQIYAPLSRCGTSGLPSWSG